ncbi:MAG: hypothetical protein QOK46_681 [Microbacteriaceae bacterium]|jgi:hypothetical protein|nr:hypothetical protein [Microbacteriaceae bacterium]
MTTRNDGATSCAWVLPTVAIGTETTGGTPFPASAGTVHIPGHGQLVMTAYVRVTGQCRADKQGVHINMVEGSFTYSFGLRVADCTLTPLRLTHRIAG